MEMIEKYVYAVTRRLPKEQRSDVADELRGNIEDMLSDSPTDAEVEKVLMSLGEPSTLAADYLEEPKFLIGPELYNQYWSVLKYGLIIFLSLGFVNGIVEAFIRQPDPEVSGWNTIGYVIDSLLIISNEVLFAGLLAFALITIYFFVFQKFGVVFNGKLYMKSKWGLKDLSDVPTCSLKSIGKVAPILEVIWGFGLAITLWTAPKWSAEIAAFVNVDRLQSYAILVFIVTMVSLAVSIYKWKRQTWTFAVATVDTVKNLLWFVVFALLVFDNQLVYKNEMLEAGGVIEKIAGSYYEIQLLCILVGFIMLVVFVWTAFWEASINQKSENWQKHKGTCRLFNCKNE